MKKGAGAILQDKDGKFLLQLRDNKKGIKSPGKWAIFGGGVEKGETPKEAATREIFEELELRLDKNFFGRRKLFWFGHFIYFIPYKKRIDKSKLKLHEGQEIGSFSRKEILKMKGVAFPTKILFLFQNKSLLS